MAVSAPGLPALCACPECDLLHRRVALAPGARASCGRCGAALYVAEPPPLDVPVALLLAAAILLAVTQGAALLELHFAGNASRTTILGAVIALREQGMALLAALVATTTILLPWAELLLLAALLLPLRLGRVPRYFGTAARWLRRLRPWNMAEVLLLGALVALVRLGALADVVVGPALWALAALIGILAALGSSVSTQALWDWAGAVRDGEL
ncbi:MAG TPA: paraquat-inducible protein A [Burkholderiaceae bacterium]|nr:paraquat-inducible protein A [Burkholderiaceae bacterium]